MVGYIVSIDEMYPVVSKALITAPDKAVSTNDYNDQVAASLQELHSKDNGAATSVALETVRQAFIATTAVRIPEFTEYAKAKGVAPSSLPEVVSATYFKFVMMVLRGGFTQDKPDLFYTTNPATESRAQAELRYLVRPVQTNSFLKFGPDHMNKTPDKVLQVLAAIGQHRYASIIWKEKELNPRELRPASASAGAGARRKLAASIKDMAIDMSSDDEDGAIDSTAPNSAGAAMGGAGGSSGPAPPDASSGPRAGGKRKRAAAGKSAPAMDAKRSKTGN